MKILMIAPQPFLEERGAPFAIYHHVRALLNLGFEIDLVTYHLGQPVHLPGLRVYRIPNIPFVRQIKVGPSWIKIFLDILVFFLAFKLSIQTRYNYIHTHEEAGLIGIILSAIFGPKHLYYMHSNLPQQVVSSDFTSNPLLIGLVEIIQKFLVRYSHSIITICPDIELTANKIAPGKPIYMIENSAIDENLPLPDPEQLVHLREQLQIDQGPIILYTGTLETYQGIDILLKSIPKVIASYPDVCYVIVGGQPEQVETMKQMALELNIIRNIRFTGKRPLTEMPVYMGLADILVSPRSKGTNTPLKLYTYLHTGKPILATAIYSQTQVLSSETAMLVSPNPDALAQGAIWLLRHPQQAHLLGQKGRIYAEEHYSWPVFQKKVAHIQCEFTGLAIRMPEQLDIRLQKLSILSQKEEEKSCAV